MIFLRVIYINIKKIIKFSMHFSILKYKFFLFSPEKYDYVILDELHNDIIKPLVSNQSSIFILKQRKQEFYISFRILINFLKIFKNKELYYLLFINFKEIYKMLKFSYIKATLEIVNPRAVITFFDNNDLVHWISKNCCAFPVIAIQNGARLRYCARDNSQYYLQHFFCWGDNEKSLFKSYGYKVKNYYPVGSLKASLFYKKTFYEDQYDLLIVSSWRGNIGFSNDFVQMMEGMKKMDLFLSKYIKKNKLNAAIILRSEEKSKDYFIRGYGSEYEYFKSIYGDSAKIFKANHKKGLVYKLMQKSNLSVSSLSSALLEIYGMRKKVIYLNFIAKKIYHCDFNNKIVLHHKEEKETETKLNKLIRQSYSSYIKEHSDYMKYMMNFSEKKTHQIIRKKITQILKSQ
jgi:hypothetical protein